MMALAGLFVSTAVQLPDIQPRLTAYAAAMRSALGLSEEPT